MRRITPLLVATLAALVLGSPRAHAAPGDPPGKAPPRAPSKAGKAAPRPQKPPARDRKGGKPGKDGKARSGPDEVIRRSIAGGPTAEDAQKGAESPELIALRQAEREIFAPAAPRPGTPWPGDSPFPLPIDPSRPVVHASGLPPQIDAQEPVQPLIKKERDLAWIQALKLPDLPVKWDERVIRYLQFFRDDPRGRSMAALGWRRAGRYRELMQSALRAEKIPQSLIWVSMVESTFEPTIRSPAGAAGLWQFMPDGGRIYGLRVDRWLDERLDPALSSQGAARYLSDLHRRFGGWELALAAYNMGYGGMLSAIRKYNTNDFWELSRFEAGIPWETTLYVPKIIAFAVVGENPAAFGLTDVTPEPALAFETVKAGPATSLQAVARASGASEAEVEQLNPHLRAHRTPPSALAAASTPDYDIHVPAGRGAETGVRLASEVSHEPKLARYTVRFGQTLEAIARETGSSRSRLAELNALARDEYPRSGDVLLVPEGFTPPQTAERPTIVVPRAPSRIAGKKRVFYRVIPGDTLAAIAGAFRATPDELRAWNAMDPSVRLQEATTLQLFVDPDQDLSGVVALREDEANLLVVGSDEFFTWFENQKGRTRLSVKVQPRDTWRTVAQKYGLSVALLERINRRSRGEALRPGESLVVYTKKPGARGAPDRHDEDGPLVAPHPEDLPAVPAGEAASSDAPASPPAEGG
jgi:membrane-bound lytic murein transglycosylase D